MFAYAMLGTNDLPKALRFYDALMALLGQERCWTGENEASWGALDAQGVGFCVTRPFDGEAARVGNGVMLAFKTPTAELVKTLHETALEMGGTSEGAPGLRPHYGDGFYVAYARDPDGNKIAFVCYDATEGA
ncbi:lactoylglutathione lyase [Agaricicola taiwanensis]|uniref:Lactoylglutathione lyase n=1 Tax=Agaricicola taiwanensis TaxID=591372 RepID=A0A8J2VUT3_9RHOB|nr:VOC family protein [Agaricicola taiwanensis]GGE38357.1 lactoylglutathione lyase [Agaricicola taiwanensis]